MPDSLEERVAALENMLEWQHQRVRKCLSCGDVQFLTMPTQCVWCGTKMELVDQRRQVLRTEWEDIPKGETSG